MQIYNIIIIGLGGMGQQMLDDLNNHQQFNVIGAFDPAQVARDRVQQLHPTLTLIDRLTPAFIAQTDIIYIASPPDSHVDYVHLAIDHNKAIFCEKPLGIDLDKIAALVDRLHKTQIINAVNFNHTFSFCTNETLKRIQAGLVGQISHITMNLHLDRWPRPFQVNADWLKYRHQGGFTREVISHWLYFCRRLFGDGQLLDAYVNFPAHEYLAETFLLVASNYLENQFLLF